MTWRDWRKIEPTTSPHFATISPIPENIALLEAEKIVREREPGDNSPQKSVVGQLNLALKEASDD